MEIGTKTLDQPANDLYSLDLTSANAQWQLQTTSGPAFVYAQGAGKTLL